MLNNGDILGIHEKTFLSFFTRIAQLIGGYGSLSSITHIGVARQIDGLWYSQEMDGRHNVLTLISFYTDQGIQVDVYRGEGINSSPDFIIPIFNRFMASPISYNIIDLFKIGFHLIFRFKRAGSENQNSQDCSPYGMYIIQAANWIAPSNLSKMPSPSELCSALTLIGTM